MTKTAKPEDFARWLHAVVNRMLGPSHPDHDDLVNEGLWTMAQALEKAATQGNAGTGRDVAYAIRCAETRLRDLAYRDRPPTGHEPMRGSQPAQVVASWDGLTETSRERIQPVARDIAEMAAWAYHHGEIHQAVGELPPAQRRSAVQVMYGLGMSKAEKNEWYKARARLARRLAHLDRDLEM